MIDHIGFPVSDYPRAKSFYAKALAPLGYSLVMEVTQEQTGHDPAAGFGADGKPDFWIGGEGGLNKPMHVAIVAKDRATVDAFYQAALAAGGRDNGAPGIRAHYHPELLRRLRARSGRPQHRSGLPHAGVRPFAAPRAPGTSPDRYRCRIGNPWDDAVNADRTSRNSACDTRPSDRTAAAKIRRRDLARRCPHRCSEPGEAAAT